MPNPIAELLTRTYQPPDDKPDRLPAFLETSGGPFVSTAKATKAQIRLAAKLHHEIARRHELLAEKLDQLASGELGIGGEDDADA